MLEFADLNWWAVIAATIVGFLLGGIWYGPLFGNAWLAALGKTAADIEPSATPFVVSFVTSLVTAVVLAGLIASLGLVGWFHGAVLGLLAGIALAAQVRGLMSELEAEDRVAASEILSQELHPYLVRSKMGEQTLATRDGDTSRAPILAHVALGRARGADALGELIDRVVLELPTSQAFRERAVAAARLALADLLVAHEPPDLEGAAAQLREEIGRAHV